MGLADAIVLASPNQVSAEGVTALFEKRSADDAVACPATFRMLSSSRIDDQPGHDPLKPAHGTLAWPLLYASPACWCHCWQAGEVDVTKLPTPVLVSNTGVCLAISELQVLQPWPKTKHARLAGGMQRRRAGGEVYPMARNVQAEETACEALRAPIRPCRRSEVCLQAQSIL